MSCTWCSLVVASSIIKNSDGLDTTEASFVSMLFFHLQFSFYSQNYSFMQVYTFVNLYQNVIIIFYHKIKILNNRITQQSIILSPKILLSIRRAALCVRVYSLSKGHIGPLQTFGIVVLLSADDIMQDFHIATTGIFSNLKSLVFSESFCLRYLIFPCSLERSNHYVTVKKFKLFNGALPFSFFCQHFNTSISYIKLYKFIYKYVFRKK